MMQQKTISYSSQKREGERGEEPFEEGHLEQTCQTTEGGAEGNGNFHLLSPRLHRDVGPALGCPRVDQ